MLVYVRTNTGFVSCGDTELLSLLYSPQKRYGGEDRSRVVAGRSEHVESVVNTRVTGWLLHHENQDFLARSRPATTASFPMPCPCLLACLGRYVLSNTAANPEAQDLIWSRRIIHANLSCP